MGSNLPLTLINTVLYFSHLFINFFITFFKPRNSLIIGSFLHSILIVYPQGSNIDLTPFSQEGNSDKLTQRLREGIDNSTHMICVVSTATIKSYWVPFEVGYGYRHIILGVLTLKGIDDVNLPDYMKTTHVIRGTKSLNTFVAELLSTKRKVLQEHRVIKGHTELRHPLDDVLDWNR